MLSVVVLTYNSVEFIKGCLDSVFQQSGNGLKIIIVDNGSTDGTVDLLKQIYPQVELIENSSNLGAAWARNLGIEKATGEWILVLDCDIILVKDFLSLAAERLCRMSSDVGAIQPKVLSGDGRFIYSSGIYLSRIRRFFDIGRGQAADRFNQTGYVFGACSACAFYRRTMLNELKDEYGYFDRRFFFLVEDVDLAWRAKRKGWRVAYFPELICYHNGNSSATSRKRRRYLCFHNRYLMIMKNESLAGRLRLFAISFWYELLRYLCLVLSGNGRLRAQ